MQLSSAVLMPKLVRKLLREAWETTMKAMFAVVFGLAVAVAPAAWAQRPDRKVDQPIVRSFNWFAYVGANDIRAGLHARAAATACA